MRKSKRTAPPAFGNSGVVLQEVLVTARSSLDGQLDDLARDRETDSSNLKAARDLVARDGVENSSKFVSPDVNPNAVTSLIIYKL